MPSMQNFDESKVRRGATTAASNPGSFASHQRTPPGISLGDAAHGDEDGESASTSSRSSMNRPAPIKRISLTQSARSISEFTRESAYGDYDLNPPYQRGSVWDDERRVALIRSVLLGLPVGNITLNARPNPEVGQPFYAVVDGKQRIEALRAFVSGDIQVPAHWFDDADLNDADDVASRLVSYHDLSLRGQRVFTRNPIAVTDAHVSTIEDEAMIYRLVNTGGVAQAEEDLANARAVETGEQR